MDLTPSQRNNLLFEIGHENVTVECYKRCQLRHDLVVGSRRSQRCADINRNNHRICYRRPRSHSVECGEVEFFANTDNYGLFAWIRTLDDLDFDRKFGIVSFGRLGRHRWIHVEWIKSLIGIIREGGVNHILSDVDLFK